MLLLLILIIKEKSVSVNRVREGKDVMFELKSGCSILSTFGLKMKLDCLSIALAGLYTGLRGPDIECSAD